MLRVFKFTYDVWGDWLVTTLVMATDEADAREKFRKSLGDRVVNLEYLNVEEL